MPLIPALGIQKQADPCVFEASLVKRVSLGQPGLHREMLSPSQKKKKNPN